MRTHPICRFGADRRERLAGSTIATVRRTAAITVALALAGCGASTSTSSSSPATTATSAVASGGSATGASGSTARFNACIGNSKPGLSASGHPVVDGATEPIVDQLHGIVGNVWLYESHAEAEANAGVMTGYPVRIVRGAYMVEVNPNAKADDSLAIQSCAADIVVSAATTETGTTQAAPAWYAGQATCLDPHMKSIAAGTDDPALDAYFSQRFGPPPAQAKLGWVWSAELVSDCTDPNAPINETLSQFASHDAEHHTYYYSP